MASSVVVVVLVVCAAAGVESIAIRVVEGQPSSGTDILPDAYVPSIGHLRQGALRMLPVNYTGPEHLQALHDNCYTALDNRYQYSLCLFSNMTQQVVSEHVYNTPVLLGVFSGWVISEGQFLGLQLEEGSSCNGGSAPLHRSTQVWREVLLHCGSITSLTTVEEPSQCRYFANFTTPLVCGDSTVMAVYPRLNQQLQQRWDTLYTEYTEGLLTSKGYDRLLQQRVYQPAGLVLSDDRRRLLMDKASANSSACEWRVKVLQERVQRLESELMALGKL